MVFLSFARCRVASYHSFSSVTETVSCSRFLVGSTGVRHAQIFDAAGLALMRFGSLDRDTADGRLSMAEHKSINAHDACICCRRDSSPNRLQIEADNLAPELCKPICSLPPYSGPSHRWHIKMAIVMFKNDHKMQIKNKNSDVTSRPPPQGAWPKQSPEV